jgi:uncharacterized protein YjbI with pentapeptide repeats
VSQTADLRSKEFREIEKLLQPEALRASFSAIRDAHTALKEYGDGADLPDLLSMFLKEATRSGASISDRHTRSKAQSILDYWSLRLAAIAPEKSLDAQLDEFVAPEKPAQDRPAIAEEPAAQAEPAAPQPSVPGPRPAEDNDQIAIRFAAAARLWRDTDYLKGFLLEGDALALGAKFRERDPAIDALVTESENAIRLRRRRGLAWLVSSLLATVITIIWIHSWLFPWLAKSEARQAALYSTEHLSPQEISSLERRFARIAFYQRFMPADKIADVFLTSALFSQLDLRGIVLPAANFVQTKFKKVQFDGANLANSSFSESPSIANVDFDRANLSYANFRSSTLTEQTSFENANLYRANFDYTNLCGVNFGGARLKKASFRGVYLKDFAGFANSGWWLASGWNSENYNKLLTVEDSEEDIQNSAGFRADLAEATEYLLGTTAGTLDRAMALNSYALVLASWGLAGRSDPVVASSLAQASNCMNDSTTPDDALTASLTSVCILESPQQPQQHTEQIKRLKPIVYDTLGYLQLQRNNVDDALASFESAAAIGSRTGDGGREFRHAAALFAAGRHADAFTKLEYSMDRLQYVPSHELKTLKHLLGGGGKTPTELLERVLKKIDDRWPESLRSCLPS